MTFENWTIDDLFARCVDEGALVMDADEFTALRRLIAEKSSPTAMPGAWIACSDRMPADETTVLVRNDEGVVWIADVDHGGQFYPDEFPIAKISHGDITRWMPIPADHAPTK